jgi:hypothetical protein
LDEEAILKSLQNKMLLLLKSTISWRSWREYFKSVGIKQPCPQEFVVVNDSFGESGTPAHGKIQIKQSSNCCSSRTSDQKKIIYLSV